MSEKPRSYMMASGGTGRGRVATAVAVALAIISGVGVSSVEAAGLGTLTVQSGLGQPLRAEVELLSVAPDERESLTARVASAEAFRAQELEYKEYLSSVKTAVENRNGKYFIKLTSSRPMNVPFVDLVLEINWASGRFSRAYTFLLDPPGQRNAAQATRSGAAPIAGAATGSRAGAASGPVRTIDPTTGRLVNAPTRPRQDAAGAQARPGQQNAAAQQPAGQPAGAAATSVVVGQGETLGMIANRVRPASASLEQTIVAIYRNNPTAFIQNNPHLIRQGRTLNIPAESDIAAIDANDAGRQLRMAARDFRSYKERLASNVTDLGATGGATTASGTITAPADPNAGAQATQTDRLELSRSENNNQGAGNNAVGVRDSEAQVARDAALREANSRIAELEKNVNSLRSMLELKDKSLAELQKQLDQARAAGASVSGAVAPAGDAAAEAGKNRAEVERLAAEKAAAEKAAADAEKAAREATDKLAAERNAAEKAAADAARDAEARIQAARAEAEKAAADKLAAAQAQAGQAMNDAGKASADVGGAAAGAAAGAAGAAGAAAGQAADDSGTTAEKAAADARAEVDRVTGAGNDPAQQAPVAEGQQAGSVFDNLTQNPLLLPGLGAFAVVAGLGYWMLRRRRREEDVFADSLGADEFTANSLFGTTGGQSVDTMTGGTSTQMTTISESTPTEVDPIAEAEVYIAYGRETQAEEILREALKRQPERQAIRLKLLEIYAGRKDTVAFSRTAREMHEMTGGLNEEWARVVDMGAALDPDNPLYGVNGGHQAAAPAGTSAPEGGLGAGTMAVGAAAAAAVSGLGSSDAHARTPAQDDNLMAFGGGRDDQVSAASAAPAADAFPGTRSGPLAAMPSVDLPSLDLDVPLSMDEDGPSTVTDLNVDTTITDSLNMDAEPSADVDLENIGLDLSPSTISGPVTISGAASSQWQEMASKLDLASAYTEIGDKEGARELLEEVMAGGDTTQKQRASELLAEL